MRVYKSHHDGQQNHASALTSGWCLGSLNGLMNSILRIVTILLVGGTSLAQEGLVIRTRGSQVWPRDAEKIYVNACSAVERELRVSRPLRPRVTLVLGAHENGAYLDPREIRLTKWDPYMFAQGVVFFAIDELLPERERLAVAKRAVTWAGSTVAVDNFRK